MGARLQQDECTQNDYVRLFAESAEPLRWLCYSLAGDEELSEKVLAAALEQCLKGAERVFRDWMVSWARRLIIRACAEIAHPWNSAIAQAGYPVLPMRLTVSGRRGSVRITRHGAHRPDNPSEVARFEPPLCDTRVASRRRPALRVGVLMSRQSSRSRFCSLVFTCVTALGMLSTGRMAAQESTSELLTLDQAIQIAVANNRSLKIASLEVDKSKWQVAEVKTKRLPSFSGSVLGSQLLSEVSFSFPAGAFGTFPGKGPFPTRDTKITTPRQPIAYVLGQATQPLSQLYKIQLGVRAQELSAKLAGEKARAERQFLVKDVKQAYYAVLQSESELEAAEANVRQYQELDRVVLQRVSQEAALKSDSLEVKAKFANEQYKVVQLRNTLDSRKEYLNHLLGRDIRTEFRTEHVPGASLEEIDLRLAQSRALGQRPEIKEAELSVRQAEYDRRMARADYIPELGLAFNYASNFNVDVLPRNMTSIGFELKWEPWDWGRRKDVVNQKKVTETQAQAQLQEARSQVLMDVNSRFRKLEESRMLIACAQAEREAAQQRLQEVSNQYGQQAVLLTDVLKQQAAAAAAGDDYQQALLGFWSAKSEFEKSLGEDQ